MADLALQRAGNQMDVVQSVIQDTHPAADAITAGQAVRYDTTTGRWRRASNDSAANNRVYGIATRSCAIGETVTAIRKGVLDGFNLDAMAYDQDVHLGVNGAVADATGGAAPRVLGRVIPVRSQKLGSNPDKLFFVDL